MAATWTKAGQVRRAFKAGPPRRKDRVVSPDVAVHEACILRIQLRRAMTQAGLSGDDVQVGLALMTPNTPDKEDAVYLLGPVPEPKRLPELFAELAKIGKQADMLPLGIVIRQVDREVYGTKSDKEQAAVWPQPFLTGDRATKALKRAGQMFMDGITGKGTFS